MFLSLWSFIMNRCILLNKHALKGQLHCLQSAFIDTVLNFDRRWITCTHRRTHAHWWGGGGLAGVRILAVLLKTSVSSNCSDLSDLCCTSWAKDWVHLGSRCLVCVSMQCGDVLLVGWMDPLLVPSAPVPAALVLPLLRPVPLLPPLPPVACESSSVFFSVSVYDNLWISIDFLYYFNNCTSVLMVYFCFVFLFGCVCSNNS